jgi:hypothetical protein
MVKITSEFIVSKVLYRVLKAAIWGSVTFFIVYYLPTMLYPSDLLPSEYLTVLTDFAAISIAFTVIGQLLSGTVIGCGFGIARALVIIFFFFTVADGGIFSLTIPVMEMDVHFSIDITTILLMVISVNLLDIARNLLQAITILTNKAAEIDFAV